MVTGLREAESRDPEQKTEKDDETGFVGYARLPWWFSEILTLTLMLRNEHTS